MFQWVSTRLEKLHRNEISKEFIHLAILCDLFGMVKWPFQRLSDLQLGDQKVNELNHLEMNSRCVFPSFEAAIPKTLRPLGFHAPILSFGEQSDP